MKNIFKISLKLAFICLFFVISGCEKDLYEEQIKSSNSNKRYITIDELKNFPAAFKLYQNIDNQSSSPRNLTANESRVIYNAALDFYINTDRILYIENDSLKTFTFEIYRNDNDFSKVENLVLSFKSDTDFESYLTKYEFTDAEKDLINNGLTVPDISSKTTITTLSGNVLVSMNDYSGTIYHDNMGNCYIIDHIEQTGINEVTVYYISINCPPTLQNGDEDGNSGGGFDSTINGFGTYDPTGVVNWIVGTGVWSGGGSPTDGENYYSPEEYVNYDGIVFLDTSPVLTNQLNSGKAYKITMQIGAILNLSNNEFNYLINDYETALIILNILNHDSSESNKSFVLEMINANINGADVDFIKNVIYGINKPCQKQIVKDVIGTCSPFTELIQQTFDSTDKVNIRFTSEDNLGGNAVTSPVFSGTPDNFTIKIKFDNAFLDNSTNLGMAATTLHELVHAYLINLYIKGTLVATNSNYNTLLNAFINFYNNQVQDTFDPLDNEIHNAMRDFISKMGNSLYNYALSKNINVTADYCEKLAWGTMSGYDLFTLSLTAEQQIENNNIYAYEQDNIQPQAEGTPCN